MIILVWALLYLFYLAGAFLFYNLDGVEPLGAMNESGIPQSIMLCSIIASAGVGLGAFSCRGRVRHTILTNANRLSVTIVLFTCCLLLFFIGISDYDGYYNFVTSPYIPIFKSSRENSFSDTVISSSGLLACFTVLSIFKSSIKTPYLKGIILSLSMIVLLSIFIQGRRETFILLMICYIMHKCSNIKFTLKSISKVVALFVLVIFVSAVGLYFRESEEATGGSLLSSIYLSILYETHFTVATIANQIEYSTTKIQSSYSVLQLFSPIFFVLPRFMFSILGFNKDEFFDITSDIPFEDKGGSFVFSGAYYSYGYLGVFIHALFLGYFLMYFWKLYRQYNLPILIFPVVSLTFVTLRKDLIYGFKYISLLYITILFSIFIIESISLFTKPFSPCVLPKKR